MEKFEIENGVLVKYNGEEKRVIIPEGVTKIEKRAFYENETIEEVIIANTVTELGKGAFFKCSALTKATISKGITNIDRSVFHKCPLTEITYNREKDSITAYINNDKLYFGPPIPNE